MRKKLYEFIVKVLVLDEAGRSHVIGRGGDFPIRIGDRFVRVFRYQPRKHPEEAGRPPVRDQEQEVNLSVVCIHAYDRSLPELGEGMTGTLTLEGDGADRVAPGSILGSIDDERPVNLPMTNPTERTVSV